ncbi:MAG: hypothetical protein M1825_002579 [Sarcosagium campestre]|nr:MAG: hypothetical protein M1825_002579 [Sarcosagium campestre]
MARRLITISAVVCLVGTIYLLSHRTTQLPLTPAYNPKGADEPLSLTAFYTAVPYTSSWSSWWHPERLRGAGTGLIGVGWNILYHLGGNGPWIEKVDGIVEGGIGTPDGCRVEQIHMMSRHAERFPTKSAGGRMLDLLERIRATGQKLGGDLKFVNDWQYFTSDPSNHFEQLTTTGPFAGTLEAFTTGVKLRTRYGHLLESGPSNTNLWASDSNRVIDTARYFSAGFFGLKWQDLATLHVIPETAERGADTLTPGDTCRNYIADKQHGHDYGAAMLVKFRSTYLPTIADRLERQNPYIRFTDAEVYSMQEMCGFETIIRGSSPWCDVFTRKDWANFEYARDVIHYYRAGPGNPFGPIMGHLWLNATTQLLKKGPSAGPFFFSFVHDGDIIPLLAALPLPASGDDLPVTHRPSKHEYQTSQLVPMGGRIIFERLSCRARDSSSASKTSSAPEHFVRININDGIVALPSCHNGPGSSCPLAAFEKLVARRGQELGDFREVCGLSTNDKSGITFLHQ